MSNLSLRSRDDDAEEEEEEELCDFLAVGQRRKSDREEDVPKLRVGLDSRRRRRRRRATPSSVTAGHRLAASKAELLAAALAADAHPLKLCRSHFGCNVSKITNNGHSHV